MPLQRVSQAFRDISLSLNTNPLNLDLVDLRNETAIARSVQNLILTEKGERPFNQNLGSNVSRTLFENVDLISSATIQSSIEEVINNYEPKIGRAHV